MGDLASTPNLVTLSVPAEVIQQANNNQNYSLFAPNQPLNSSPAPPDLSLPDIPYEETPSLLDSPTPPASNNPAYTELRAQSETPIVHAMLVDGEGASATPPPAEQQPATSLQRESSEEPEDLDAEPVTALMSEYLTNNKDHQFSLHDSNAPSPGEKFMRTCMPPIRNSHPTAPWAFIEERTITEWDTFPTYKLIALPLGFEARQHLKHNSIRKRLLAAVIDITRSQRAGVCSPGPTDRIIKSRRGTPRGFLIHSLTTEQYFILLRQKVWISSDISFRVIVYKPTCPDLLFTISEWSSQDETAVYNLVKAVWQQALAQETIHELIRPTIATPTQTPQPDLNAFVSYMWVEPLNIREAGGRLTPQFNVYAKGKFFTEHKIWTKVRGYLARLTYNSNLLGGTGTPKIALHHCNLCHAADHPRGLCPFPTLPGYNGPSGLGDKSN